MGGNAFELAHRISAKDYENFCEDLSWSLRNVMGEGTRFYIPKSVREKESHGDVDILVVGPEIESAVLLLGKHYLIEGLIKNPSGYNLLIHWEEQDIQVDLNKVSPSDWDFAKEYFSWNDLGNLVGRIAHRQGLKFGHNGLWYIHRDGDKQLGEILITADYHVALLYLGFDLEQYKRGFDTFDEMFRWVETSRYFEPSAFPLEHRNHQARMRDKKRKTYQAFLQRLNFHGEYVPVDKEAWLKTHMNYWPKLRTEIESLDKENELNKAYRAKVNGLIVRDLTGLDGRELGKLMNIVRVVLPREASLKYTPAAIEAGIMFAHQIYKDEKNEAFMEPNPVTV